MGLGLARVFVGFSRFVARTSNGTALDRFFQLGSLVSCSIKATISLPTMSRLWWVGKSKSKSKNKNNGEIQGSLHGALDGETVQRFGRDDVLVWGEGKQTTAKTEADPYGMTNKRTSNVNSTGKKNKQ